MTPLEHGTPIYRTADIRRIEAIAQARPDPLPLMEKAGLAAAQIARDLAHSGKRIVVLAGPGNNGGDAFVVARHLKSWWFDVSVTFTGDPEKLSADAAAAFQSWRDTAGAATSELPRGHEHGLIIDGLFGIGLQRDVTGRFAELVQWVNRARAPVLALDVPSGIESDSGRVLGCAVRASHTVTFIALKPGLLTLDGPEHSGVVHMAPLGLDPPSLVSAPGQVIGPGALRRALPPRNANSHKGTYGSVGIIGGSAGMLGAALLTGRAALKLGAGRVYVGLLDDGGLRVDPLQPELMLRPASSVIEVEQLTSLAVGPGLGTSSEAEILVRSALGSTVPLVLDADALNVIARSDDARAELTARDAPTLLTPHPAEAARLLHVATADVQQDRVASALKLAETHRSCVVLKGVGSVCASPDRRWAVNTTGNPGMASAGMGDVLTGFVAALLAQGAAPERALHAAVYGHGAAADALVERGTGPVGLTASETLDAARALFNAACRTSADE